MKDDWRHMEQDSTGLQCEWGSEGNVRFPDSSQVMMYDSEGHPVLCACGKPAGSAAIGKEAMVAWCSECSPLNKYEAEFVFRKPVEARHNTILMDAWTKDLRMIEGEENGDTDWYCPEGTPPKDGEPVYLKMEIIYKAWRLHECKLSKWILEDNQVPEGKILAWQPREDGKNYHDKEG